LHGGAGVELGLGIATPHVARMHGVLHCAST
jgi:hypothetical protein